MSNLSKQAENSISLYRGQNPSTIKQLLAFQNKNVVDELLKFFNCNDISTLSVKLSQF